MCSHVVKKHFFELRNPFLPVNYFRCKNITIISSKTCISFLTKNSNVHIVQCTTHTLVNPHRTLFIHIFICLTDPPIK